MAENKPKNWIYRSLDICLAVSDGNDIEVVVKDCETEIQENLVFNSEDKFDTEEIIERIGEAVYSWIALMEEQLEDEDE